MSCELPERPMSERTVLIQHVTNQRNKQPTGLRVWSDGLVQRADADNRLPTATERLDLDRDLNWQDERRLQPEQLEKLRAVIEESGFFGLPPHLLINYCTEDPGTAIWIINLDGRVGRVVVFDPRPRRSPELDRLAERINDILAP